MNEEICCPKFDPAPWDEKLFDWDKKMFVKQKVTTFFHMPLNFGAVMKTLDEKARNAHVGIQDGMCLSDHTSKWKMDVYLAVDEKIPGEEHTTLSGQFFSKVYEGPFQDTGKWCKDFESIVSNKGLKILKWYMWYTTCPKCAKKYGKNYVVVLAQVT